MQHYIVVSPDDIAHYGVLGMRWGVRRSNEVIKYKKETRHNHGKTKEERKAWKAGLKDARKKAMNRLNPLNSRSTNDKISSENFGKSIAKAILMGSYGSLKYDEARADRGNSRLLSATKGSAHNIANKLTLNSQARKAGRENKEYARYNRQMSEFANRFEELLDKNK